jgi:hypothetical protein
MCECVGTIEKRIDLIMLPRHESVQRSGELFLALHTFQNFTNQEFPLEFDLHFAFENI